VRLIRGIEIDAAVVYSDFGGIFDRMEVLDAAYVAITDLLVAHETPRDSDELLSFLAAGFVDRATAEDARRIIQARIFFSISMLHTVLRLIHILLPDILYPFGAPFLRPFQPARESE